mgnify:CR=1 FL=1
MGELSYYTTTFFIWLVDTWNSKARIKNMNPLTPLEILSAGEDELIAPHHQKAIMENSPSEDITFLYDEEADHNGIREVLYSDIEAHIRFLELCVERAKS